MVNSLVRVLSPVFLVSLLLGVVLVYGLTTLYLWLREVQRLEQNTAECEKRVREKIQEKGDEITEGAKSRIAAFRHERKRFEELLGHEP